MNDGLLSRLRCPFCGGPLRASRMNTDGGELLDGVLECDCGRYPVVAGIPILKKWTIGAGAASPDAIIALLSAGRFRDALLALISPPAPAMAPTWMAGLPRVPGSGRLKAIAHAQGLRRWRREAARRLALREGVTACEVIDFYFLCSGPQRIDAADYFLFRFGQPRHVVALSFLSLIESPHKPVLDLACGFGHLTHNVVQRAANQLVVGTDTKFFPLYVARHWIAPAAQYVCCDADRSLPFPDDSFSAVLCSDAFHDFEHKTTAANELKRLVGRAGMILLVALRNALMAPSGFVGALPPEGYRALVADLPHCLKADRDSLARYLDRRGPALARSADVRDLAAEPWFSVVASHRTEAFQDYGRLDHWTHAEGPLGLNPLFAGQDRDDRGNVHLWRRFPSRRYEEEHALCKEYLPEAVEVEASLFDQLSHGRRTPAIDALIGRFVLLSLPEKYGRPANRDSAV